jgi:hypothetical protein
MRAVNAPIMELTEQKIGSRHFANLAPDRPELSPWRNAAVTEQQRNTRLARTMARKARAEKQSVEKLLMAAVQGSNEQWYKARPSRAETRRAARHTQRSRSKYAKSWAEKELLRDMR